MKFYMKTIDPYFHLIFQSELDLFSSRAQRLGLEFDLKQCQVITFSKRRVFISYNYFLDCSVKQIFLVKYLGIYLPSFLPF